MSLLFQTKYPNNTRTVSGTPALKGDDVVLECDTTAGPVIINLFEIPAGYWSTAWRLYVIDKSNNASVNNITINAFTGQKINSLNTIVINQRGGGVKIVILNDTNFGATYNYLPASTPANLSYVRATKLLNNPITNYIPIAGAGVRSVVSGTSMTSFDSKNESGVTGFDLASGIWTVPSTGAYAVSVKLVTRVASGINDNGDGSGGWTAETTSIGQIGIAAIINTTAGTDIVCANKQFVNLIDSDVNISCATEIYNFTINDAVIVNAINQTTHDVLGIASADGAPPCYIEIAIIKIT